MLATLATTFSSSTEASTVLPAAEKERVAQALEENAQVVSNTRLAALLAEEPPAVQDEIIRINTVARPPALQVALLVPLIAAVLGLLISFRMARLRDPDPPGAGELALGG